MKLARVAFLAWIASWTASAVRADRITEIVAFGDSLTDTGNVFLASGGTLPPSPPYFDGRASNGPLYVERLAERIGLPTLAPSLTGGTNYAFYGAESSLTGLSKDGTPNIGTQVGLYLSGSPTPTPGTLFVLYGGANDFLFGGVTDPSVPVANLSASISALAAAGATRFLVPNLPPLGSTPLAVGTANEAPLNALSAGFNSLLASELNRLETSLGISIAQLDIFGITRAAMADPASFGFSNVTDPAFDPSTGSLASNPDEYFFWDPVHPTRVAHRILGDRAATLVAVPEPSSIVLSGLGVVSLIAVARRRRDSQVR